MGQTSTSDCQDGPVNAHGDYETARPWCGSPDTCHDYTSQHADGAQLLQHRLCARLLHSDENLCHSSCATEAFDNQPLLDVMAGLLDKVASTHVFGNYGSRDRRKGLITLGTIQDTEKHQELSSSSEHRWHQFLEVWHTAGWGRFDVIVMVDELRPLLWRHPQQPEHIASIDAQQMAVYCAKYSRCQGHRHSELQTSLLSFLDAVQNQFSSPKAVLLPAEDVYDRLSTVKLSHYEAQSPP